MAAIILLVITLTLSLVITRVGTVALVLTGLSHESAHFQAWSAFYGVGFTTNESESVVNHPVRRRIIMFLMVLGNLGIAALMASVMVSCTSASRPGEWLRNLAILVGALGLLWASTRSQWFNRTLERLITAALRRWTDLDVHDYVALLHLAAGYAVLEMHVSPDNWLAGKTLRELKLSQEGILVLGIRRPDNLFVGAPTGPSPIRAHDALIIYGPIERLEEIGARPAGPAGAQAHETAVEQQNRRIEEQARDVPGTGKAA